MCVVSVEVLNWFVSACMIFKEYLIKVSFALKLPQKKRKKEVFNFLLDGNKSLLNLLTGEISCLEGLFPLGAGLLQIIFFFFFSSFFVVFLLVFSLWGFCCLFCLINPVIKLKLKNYLNY